MISRIARSRAARAARKLGGRAGSAGRAFSAPLRRSRAFAAALVASLLAALYWGLLASDQYVSEAHIIIQKTELTGSPGMDFGSLLGNVDGSRRADQLLLRDHLLSIDMLRKLDTALDLRAHYSDPQWDRLSRMRNRDAPIELFHRYYLSRVLVEFDDYAGILVIRAQAYTPEMARAVATALVAEGERFMNALAQGLARDQVAFLEGQVDTLRQRLTLARQNVLDYQNREGLVSPESTAENVTGIVHRLEGKLTELQIRRASLLGYLVPQSPDIVELDLQIDAIKRQIGAEKKRLAAPAGKPLNRTVEAFQRLQAEAEFATDVYRTALLALERGRVEATRTLRKVSVLRTPVEPEYPLRPRRLYNTVVFILLALLAAGLLHLLGAIIRDHKD